MSRIVLTSAKLDRIDDLCSLGVEELIEGLEYAAQNLVPALPMDIVDWMEANLYLTPEVSPARPGMLKLDNLQKGVFRAFQEAGAKRVVFQKPPRFGATLGTAGSLLYYACHEGQDVFFSERSDGPLHYFYNKFLYPILTAEAGNVSHMKRPDGKQGRQDQWTDTILTNGASAQLRSASTNGSFRQLKAGFLVLDECSSKEYQPSATNSEGDKPSLAWVRATEYRNPVMFLPSTPTEEGRCIVSREFKKSDQRVYEVPCPCCGTVQQLLPRVGDKEGAGLKFRLDHDTGYVSTYVNERGETLPDIWYQCINSQCADPFIREERKEWMIEHGAWRATAPLRDGQIGFYTWAIYSSHPQSTWSDIVAKYMVTLVDPNERQPFKNLTLAQPWDRVERRIVPINVLQDRAEAYETPCPQGVRTITWGMDNQRGTDDGSKPPRGEVVVVGWGYGEECWILGHFKIEYTPFSQQWAKELFRIADIGWRKPDGKVLRAQGGGIDVGYDFDHGVEFCHSSACRQRRIRAVRGENTRVKTQTGILTGKSQKNELFTYMRVPKQQPTDILMQRLRQDTAGPGTIHFPRSLPTEFFEQLTAVKKVIDRKKNLDYWLKLDNSEVYDCWIYAYSVMRALFILHSEFRALLLKSIGPVESGTEPLKAYDGDDRSANSELAMAIEAGAGTVRVKPFAKVKPSEATGSRQSAPMPLPSGEPVKSNPARSMVSKPLNTRARSNGIWGL